MPVTVTAKRALRGSARKEIVNKKVVSIMEVALRAAMKTKSAANISAAVSAVDRAAKKNIIHKNKAAHIKSRLSKLTATKSKAEKTKPSKTSKTKSKKK